MIVLRLSGGLGNQMFEYAYGLWVADYYNEELALDCTLLEEDNQREYSLKHMNISYVHLLTKDELARMDKKIVLKRDCVKFKNAWQMAPHNRNILDDIKLFGSINVSMAYHLYNRIAKKKAVKILSSYYQSEFYFYPIRDRIREQYNIKTLPSEENKKMLEKISNTNSVCVHIRLGDYMTSEWKNLQVCTKEYYSKAIDYIRSVITDPVFFVFSNSHDDIRYIMDNFQLGENVEYVDLNNPDYEELRLMSHCSHFIISNSSFSWWAQYLSDSQEKIVIAPKVWDKNGHRHEIYQSNWIKM